MNEVRQRVLLIAASIISARKLKIMTDEVFHYPQGVVDAFNRQLNAGVRVVALRPVLIYFIAFPYHSL